MEAISKETIASVALIQAKVSEDELAVYEAALSYALDTLGESEIERRFGASVDEIEGMRDDLREILEQQVEGARKPEPVANRT
jgi:ferritin-like metal-binding protein YciE